MADKDKIVDLNQYREEKEFDEDLFENLLNMSDEESDDFYDSIAFGDGLNADGPSGKELLAEIRRLEELESDGYLAWMMSPEKSWLNLDARPYLSLKMDLAVLYKQNGLYQKALEHFMQMFREDPNDSLGCRYEILALYILKSDYTMADAFFRSRKEHEEDAMMAIPMLISAILSDADKQAGALIEQLCDQVDGFFEFCRLEEFPMARVLDAGAVEFYEANSKDSLYIALYSILPLLLTTSVYIQAYLNDHFSDGEVYLEDFGILSSAQLLSLNDYDIKTATDIQYYSEEELLTIPKIGKVTLKKLKEIGVVFRK
ncbi:hypothetical protein [Streptococcus sp. S784/96/1]|uniref:hypothetical protein n=1 Tax=Streptococcus sp. S784/96/1 TaxID=2653499 RepID=UPI00138A324D|nr:hypothetical protein [Streptococcus sp. S784/96/1]